MDRTSRRQVLATTASALAVGLAGCSGDGEETTTGDGGGDETTTSDGGSETTSGETTTAEMTEATTAGDGTTGGGTSVTVAPGGDLVFAPSSLTVETGATVEWSWDGSGHNIVVDSQPDGADWGGTDGDGSTTYGSGHTHTHTFETAGTYSYYCQPHRGVGMTGEIVVE